MKSCCWRYWTNNWKLIFLVSFGLCVRLYRYMAMDFWYDEALQIYECYSFGLKQHEVLIMHPPLNNTLLYFWLSISTHATWIKLWSIIWAAGTFLLVYLIAAKIVSKTAGLWAAAIITIMPLHVYYSRDIRMYSLQAFLVTLAWFAFLKLDEEKSAKWFGFLSLATALALYTHYFCIFPLTAMGICSLVLLKSRQKMYLNTLALITGVLIYSPWLLRLLNATKYMMKDSEFFSPPVTLKYMGKIFSLILGSYSASQKLILASGVVVLVLFILAVFNSHNRLRIYLSGMFVFPLILIYLLGITLDYNYLIARYVTFMTPMIAIVSGIGLTKLRPRFQMIMAIVLCVPMIFSTVRLYSDVFGGLERDQGIRPHKEFSEPGQLIARMWDSTDIIGHACVSSYTPFYYYLNVLNGINPGHVIDVNNKYGDWFRKTWKVGKFIDYYPFAKPIDYNVVVKGHQRMWYVASEFDIGITGTFDTDFTHELTRHLLTTYRLIDKWSFYGCPVYLLDLTSSPIQRND